MSTLLRRSRAAIFAIASIAINVTVARCQTHPIGTDTNDPQNASDYEPSIAVNPLNFDDVVVVAFSGFWNGGNYPPGTPGMLCGSAAPVWRSTDGGVTWAKACIIQPPFQAATGPADQKIAFDRFGNLFLVEMRDSPKTDFIYRVTGAVGTPVTFGAQFGGDQPQLAVDRNILSPCVDRVYAPWRNSALTDFNVHLASAPSGGTTLTDVVVATHNQRFHRTARIAIGPDGKVFVIYKVEKGGGVSGFEAADFMVARSDDCGATWNANGAGGSALPGMGDGLTLLEDHFGNMQKGKTNIARSSDAWIDVDQGNGDVVAAYVQRTEVDHTLVFFSQIYVALSTDHGVTWSSHAVSSPSHNQFMPEVAVADNGTIGVLYIDYDDSGPSTIWRHWLAFSHDHGVTWTTELLESFDPTPLGWRVDNDKIFGDYEGLTTLGTLFYGVYTGLADPVIHTTPQTDPVFFRRPAIVKQLPICVTDPSECGFAHTDLRQSRIRLSCAPGVPCILRLAIPRARMAKFAGTGCPPHGLCPPFYTFVMDGIDPEVWRAELWDPQGRAVPYRQRRNATSTTISFRPPVEYFKNEKKGDYYFTFSATDQAQHGRTYTAQMRLTAASTPFGDKAPPRSAQ